MNETRACWAACFAAIAIAAGCATSKVEDELPAPEPNEESESSPDAGASSPAEASQDAATFSKMLVGEIEPEAALELIASRGGWPIVDGEEYLFAVLSDGAEPYRLAGDHNGWNPEEMMPGAGFYWARVAIEDAAGSGYKFVNRDSVFRADRFARRYQYDDFGELSLVRAQSEHFERWLMPEMMGLAAREIRVWMPEGPITHHLYVHDGQNVFSPLAPHGGWRLQDAVPAGVLIVAIDNSSSRMSEYTPFVDDIGGGNIGGLGDTYASYVEDHVRVHIESTYGASSRVGILGSSLGGLISLHIADRFPGRYQFVASMSGTLGWGSLGLNGETIIDRYRDAGHRDLLVYLDSGGHDGGGCADYDDDGILDDSGHSDNYCTTRQLADELDALGYEFGADLWHWYEPDAPHNESAWADRVDRPLSLFANEVN